ncbi:MAG: GIY-YIG nuclease family protein [Cyanobacteriota bacterium]
MKISDIIGITEELKSKTKIHFAIGRNDRFEPLNVFYRNEFKEWQENQSKKNFEREYILSLIYFGRNEWIFAGIYQQKGVQNKDGRFYYQTELKDISTNLIGKLVIKYEKIFRQSYPYLENCIDNFELLEILREKYTVEPFKGYENIKIKHEILKSIILQEENSWKTALSNVKGVYLISDKKTGKLYVGSAYGENAFWNRWTEYIKTGHGGNQDLKQIILENGIEYVENFQYTILETRSMNSEDKEIIKRESFWKDILLSREFGYNKN